MSEKSVLVNEDQYEWEFEKEQLNQKEAIRWKNIISSNKTPTRGISMGVLEIPPGAIMDIHHHHQQEVYYVTEGAAEVYLDNRWQAVKKGDTIYIPGDEVHGVRNNGQTLFKLVWMFPTDSWAEIEYFDD